MLHTGGGLPISRFRDVKTFHRFSEPMVYTVFLETLDTPSMTRQGPRAQRTLQAAFYQPLDTHRPSVNKRILKVVNWQGQGAASCPFPFSGFFGRRRLTTAPPGGGSDAGGLFLLGSPSQVRSVMDASRCLNAGSAVHGVCLPDGATLKYQTSPRCPCPPSTLDGTAFSCTSLGQRGVGAVVSLLHCIVLWCDMLSCVLLDVASRSYDHKDQLILEKN